MDNRPAVLDLFAGAGGLSLGFEQAGFDVHAAVECDKWACETLSRNHPATRVLQRDIETMPDEEVRALFSGAAISGIIGGPPCQGFSHSNITKRDPHDPRNSLFVHFARFVGVLKPQFFLIENVPGLLRTRLASGRPAVEIIVEAFETLGYRTSFGTLKAENFGVPQIRERLFIVGTRGARLARPLPAPTHEPGDAPLLGAQAPRQTPTLWQAISDLPPLEAGEGTEPAEYRGAPENEYQRLMREGADAVWNHTAMRHSRRVVERFKAIGIGQSQSDVAEEHAPRVRSNGHLVSQKRYDQNNRRLRPDRPSHTVPASFYANFVHPFQHRNFTPREGARIQSFPDAYVFRGKPTVVSQKLLTREGRREEKHLCQYVQIGNAVPPILARAVAANLLAQLR